MLINTIQEEMSTWDGNPTASSAVNTVDSAASERNENAFFFLRAVHAMKGRAFYRIDPAYGPVTYWADCGGSVRVLGNVDAAQLFSVQLGELL